MKKFLVNSGKSQVLIPRYLCELDQESNIHVNNEGLFPVEISWDNGFVSKINSIKEEKNVINKILFPRFVESHAHFDKSFSWMNYPNLQSNYENALSVNLEEHVTRTANTVLQRAEKSLNLAIKNGYRAIRTHVDTYEKQDQNIWPELLKLREKYSSILKLQFVALAPLDFWESDNGKELASNLNHFGGILGGVVVPPFNKKQLLKLLSNLILLANKYKLEIDLHIDESSEDPGSGIKLLLKTIKKLKSKVPITCSHLSSISLLKFSEIDYLSKQIAANNIKVIALPLTNFWLLNRKQNILPIMRPVAPIKQLQNSFVDVSVGTDNVQDPWFPFGNFDPFYLLSLAVPMLQINPWDRLTMAALITAPSRLLNLRWDGIIKTGCPADFVVVDGKVWADVISGNTKKEVIINGEIYNK